MHKLSLNRLHNCKNSHQGKTKKVLCVCSAGLLRSPTAAVVLSQEPFAYNTRAAGLSTDFALVPVDEVLLTWADEVVVMEDWMRLELLDRFEEYLINVPIFVLKIPDSYAYRDPELMLMIEQKYTALRECVSCLVPTVSGKEASSATLGGAFVYTRLAVDEEGR